MTAPGAEVPLHRALGLTDVELDAVVARIGRAPNPLELAMFSVMWSEHCSYKSSKPLLATLPTGGPDVVAGPGENAGVMRIGDGLAVAFKLESHNHPSAVEPVQGAMTGVGGILRDIFTMGARPVAVLDALKFGDPSLPRTRHLVRGVVRGVGSYGNCVGVPTIGGELVFHPSYAENPLVNVMAVGILREDRLTLAAAPGPGTCASFSGAPPAATASAARASSRRPPSARRARRSGRPSRSATRSRRSSSSRRASSSSSAASSPGSRTSARQGSPARCARRRTGQGRGSAWISTPSRAARRGWSPSR